MNLGFGILTVLKQFATKFDSFKSKSKLFLCIAKIYLYFITITEVGYRLLNVSFIIKFGNTLRQNYSIFNKEQIFHMFSALDSTNMVINSFSSFCFPPMIRR